MLKIPSELAQAIQAGECVLWTGAGIGALAGLPGWHEGLTCAIERCPADAQPQLRDLLTQGRLRPVLAYLRRHGLEAGLEAHMREDAPPIAGAEILAKLPWRACLATAYVDVLRRIFEAEGQAVEVVTHREIHRPTLRDEAGGGGRPMILPTPPSGRSIRADRALFELVEEVARARTFFFFGFDIDDPDLAEILELLGRIGRGRRHYALLPYVTEAEAEELLESRGIVVIDPGAHREPAAALVALQQAIWETEGGPSRTRADLAALDLARALAEIPIRGDFAADAAFTCDLVGVERILAELAEAVEDELGLDEEYAVDAFGRLDPSTLLRLGNVYLAHGRAADARRCYQAVRERGSGREYRSIALFNLALSAAAVGRERAAVSALRGAGAADRALALMPGRLDLEAVRAWDLTRLVVGGRDRGTRERVELWLRALARPVGASDQRRFNVEVQRASALRHHGLQRVRGGFSDGQLFGVIAEPIPGITLAEALGEGGRMEMFRALRLSMALLEALSALHGHGMIHRDIRPAQVVLGLDGPVLCGQGFTPLINLRRPTLRHLADGYVAPEVLAGQAPSTTSDLYSVAAILYRCLSGRSPSASIQPASAFQPGLDPRVDEALALALHPEPGQRLSPRRLRAELAQIVSVPLLLVSRLGDRPA